MLANLYLRLTVDDCHWEAVSGSHKIHQKAFDLLTSAALNGNKESFRLLAECYELGRGIVQDMHNAIHYYRRGADAGDEISMFRLAKLLFKSSSLSEGTEADDCSPSEQVDRFCPVTGTTTEALRWMRCSSVLGYVDATFELGKMYEFGHAVVEDHQAALNYYQAAADAGHGEAALFAANIYYSQASRSSKFELMLKAANLYRKAAESGIPLILLVL